MRRLIPVILLPVFLLVSTHAGAQQTNPNNRRELERLGIDPVGCRIGDDRCCGGTRGLGNASLSSGRRGRGARCLTTRNFVSRNWTARS